MGSNAAIVEVKHEVPSKPQSAAEIRAQVNLIQEVMRAVMKEGEHYGVIPGTKKPSLWKPGSEILLSTFHIAIEPIVEDLSTDDVARFRVTTRATSIPTGAYLGSGIGEASSNEEKYKWRRAVCQEEFDATPEHRRRIKWGKDQRDRVYQIQQVRTEWADVANTVLKMAKKRSQIDVTLTVTAASDIFTQDIEDLPEELQHEVADGEAASGAGSASQPAKPAAPVAMPQRKGSSAPPQPATQPAQSAPLPQVAHSPIGDQQTPSSQPNYETITVPQARRFFGLCMGNGVTKTEMKNYLIQRFGIEDDRLMPKSGYEEACAWAARGGK
jgi:hypothetical protein